MPHILLDVAGRLSTMQDLMTLTQAASQLNVSPNTVTAWAVKLNIALRLHPYDKRIKMLAIEEVEEIRQALAERNVLIAPTRPRALPAPAPQRRIPPVPASSDLPHSASQGTTTIPEGWVSYKQMCLTHGVSERLADKQINRSFTMHTETVYQVRGVDVKRVLDPEQQAAFLAWLASRQH
jgi:hypothetical protein